MPILKPAIDDREIKATLLWLDLTPDEALITDRGHFQDLGILTTRTAEHDPTLARSVDHAGGGPGIDQDFIALADHGRPDRFGDRGRRQRRGRVAPWRGQCRQCWRRRRDRPDRRRHRSFRGAGRRDGQPGTEKAGDDHRRRAVIRTGTSSRPIAVRGPWRSWNRRGCHGQRCCGCNLWCGGDLWCGLPYRPRAQGPHRRTAANEHGQQRGHQQSALPAATLTTPSTRSETTTRNRTDGTGHTRSYSLDGDLDGLKSAILRVRGQPELSSTGITG